ncbi:MAG: LPS assembly lipoprotein LptE [Alphaproteobacteria bacterium]
MPISDFRPPQCSLLAACLLLAACGFRPLYGGPTGEIRRLELSQVAVTPIKTRLGQTLRNTLLDRMTPEGEPTYPQYRLDITLNEYKEGVAIQSDASITRYNYQLTGTYELFDLGAGKVIYQGIARSLAAYNVAESPFATLSAERDVADRTAGDLSDQIEHSLALFFERRAR